MNKKLVKVILIISGLLLMICISSSLLFSHNIHHLDTCCEDNCTFCNIIRIAQKFIYEIKIITINVIITLFFSVLLINLNIRVKFIISSSLVKQNVQLNE